ncbi:MAG: AraC family transcriptional regulator, partial [Bacteroidaceae bacterium]|nr:AraC family transcriptional regulator [Bacteroidaceae bacterium]
VSRIFLSLLLLSSVWGGVVVRALTQRGGFYLLSRAEDLAQFARMVNEGGDTLCARLTDDIDFRAYPTTMIGIEKHCAFSGILDGQGHSITLDVRVSRQGDYSGALFRFVRDAQFQNLTLRGSVSTHGKHGAGLVCSAEGVCTFTNVVSDVDISSDSFDDCIGGLVGIAGENFLPRMADITFMNCAFTGSIRYSGEHADFVDARGIFTHHGGCFVGWKGKWNTKIYMINCYASPRSIDHSCYFNTFVRYWAGLDVGLIYAKNCYYSTSFPDYGADIPQNNNQGEARSPAQFADGSVCQLLNNGNEQNPIWSQRPGIDRLPLPTCSEFQVTGMQTFQISTEEELEHFARIVNGGDVRRNAILTADIDYRGHREMIGAEAPYEGLFDGACHKIIIDFDTDREKPALFQHLGRGGIVRNLHVDGSLISAHPYAAGIVSYLDGGFIGNCLSTVSLRSRLDSGGTMGGIAGLVSGSAVITNCIYSASIHAPYDECASLAGKVASPGLLIRNSLFLEDGSRSDSTDVSPWPLFRGNSDYVSVENSFTVENPASVYASLGHVSLSTLQNAEILYSIWGREYFDAEKTIENKDQQIKRVNIYWGILSLIFFFLLLISAQYAYFNKVLRQKYDILYRNAVREHQTWLSQQAESRPTEASLPASSSEPSETAFAENARWKALYARLLQIMENEQLYVDPAMDRQQVARHLGTNEHYLSECISHLSGYPNFSAWLASYRINHVLQLIEENPAQNVEQLYLLSGFVSHTTFTRHFRTHTGMTCKQYLMMRQKGRSEEPESLPS